MSKFILILFLSIFVNSAFSQGINFQGVARSANGTIIASSNVSLRLSIISKSADATPEYVETKTVVTNAQGIFSIVVGDATNTTVVGSFKNIVWSENPKFLKVEMDPAGGTNYLNMGATQLQYVPYSFHSYGVDGSNIKGIVPVKAGGTGVATLDELKTALNFVIPPSIDTNSLSNIINEKLSKLDTVSLSNRINSKLGLNDTINLSNRINAKLSSSDTINLSNRINYLNSKINNQSSLFTTLNISSYERDKLKNLNPGSVIWCTNCGTSGELQVFNGVTWKNLIGGNKSASTPNLDSVFLKNVTGFSVDATSLVLNNEDVVWNNIGYNGIVWSTKPNPILNNPSVYSRSNELQQNSKKDSIQISVKINNLKKNTKYYFKSFAQNSIGIGYGAESIIETNNITNKPINPYVGCDIITPTKAIFSISVESDGAEDITESGFEYSSNINFSDKTRVNVKNSDNRFELINLIPNKKYYVRAFAKNLNGETISSDTSNFISLDMSIENQKSEIVISGKTWSAKNLNVFTYRNGDPIPLVTDSAIWSNLTTGAYCYFKNDSITYGYLGKLYNMYAVNDARGLAPVGWHIPTTSELNLFINNQSYDGFLTNINGSFCYQGNKLPSNSSGFSSINAGARQPYNSSRDFEFYGGFLSSYWNKNNSSQISKYNIGNNFQYEEGINTNISKNPGFFVRLVKD
jgi:uncharacterized protein (TIGR02145 family)